MPRFTGTLDEDQTVEEAPRKGGRFGGKLADEPVKKAEPTREIPVFDPGSGMATGFTQQAPIGPSKEAVEFERREGPLGYAKEYGKGAAAGTAGLVTGLPAEILNIPSTYRSAQRYLLGKAGVPEQAMPSEIARIPYGVPEMTKKATKLGEEYLGFKPAKGPVAEGIRSTGEVLGFPTGGSALGRLVSGPLRAGSKLERLLEDVGYARTRLGKKGEASLFEREAAAAAERAGVEAKAEAERLRLRYQPVEPTAVENLARSETKVVAPDTIDVLRAGQDAESTARKLGEAKGLAAETKQATVGGKAFEEYKRIANEKQTVQPFDRSPEGVALKEELGTIIEGGPGALRTYGEGAIAIAKDAYKELFGRKAADFTASESKEAMNRIPFGSFSEQRRRQMAIDALQARESKGARSVDWSLVDDKLQELRQKAASKEYRAFGKIAVDRLENVADRIEGAIKNWVGEKNYARPVYAEASKDLNKFETKLGEALRAKEQIPYAGGPAQYQTPRVLGTLFESRSSTNFAKQLLGEAEVNNLAERYAINQLSGKKKTKDQIILWMENNEFIYEIPGLSQKLEKYAASVGRREQEAEALGVLRKQAGERVKEAKGAEKTAIGDIATARTELNKGLTALQAEDPAKLASKWSDIRSRLEATKAFKAEELDRLGEDIIKASRIADTQQRREDLRKVVGKMALKAAGVGGAGYGIYETLFGRK